MSTSVKVYCVAPQTLRAVPGSKDRTLLEAAVLRDLQDYFENIDAIASADDEDEEARPPSCEDAFRQIVSGAKYDKRFGYVYGYAYEALCTTVGLETGRDWVGIARSYQWFEEIQKALALLAIPLNLPHLIYRGPLFAIPDPDDFPGMGYWTAEEIRAADEVFRGLDLDRLDASTTAQVKDVRDALEDIRAWIASAAERPGDWLVGIHC
jgi:hypothetical protein